MKHLNKENMLLKKENNICHKEISKLKSLIEDYKNKLSLTIKNKDQVKMTQGEINLFDHFKSKLPSE